MRYKSAILNYLNSAKLNLWAAHFQKQKLHKSNFKLINKFVCLKYQVLGIQKWGKIALFDIGFPCFVKTGTQFTTFKRLRFYLTWEVKFMNWCGTWFSWPFQSDIGFLFLQLFAAFCCWGNFLFVLICQVIKTQVSLRSNCEN